MAQLSFDFFALELKSDGKEEYRHKHIVYQKMHRFVELRRTHAYGKTQMQKRFVIFG